MAPVCGSLECQGVGVGEAVCCWGLGAVWGCRETMGARLEGGRVNACGAPGRQQMVVWRVGGRGKALARGNWKILGVQTGSSGEREERKFQVVRGVL